MSGATPAPSPLLAINGLKVFFQTDAPRDNDNQGHVQALGGPAGVSLIIPENTTVALVGESGSGKSLTAMSILNLLPGNAQRQGQIMFRGQDLMTMSSSSLQHIRGQHIACVFQDPMSSLNPVLTVGQQVCEPLIQHQGLTRHQAWRQAQSLLADVQLSEPQNCLKRYPHQLSGGQQQRVMIAMAMATCPQLLIADEPTTALDVTVQQQILDLLARLKTQHQMSMLFISHDLGVVSQVADQVVVMRRGMVCESGLASQVMHAPQAAYTRALLACRVSLLSGSARLQTLDAEIGAPTAEASIPTTFDLTDPSPPVVLEAQAVRQHYWVRRGLWRRVAFPALGGDSAAQGVSFQLQRGRTLGVVGESGSGKTTLGMALLRLQGRGAPLCGGRILFKGKDISHFSAAEVLTWRRQVQVVFQNPYASLNPRMSIRQALLEPLQIHRLGSQRSAQVALVVKWLHKVGLDASALSKYPHEFSGGQRQRIAIARCLTLQPEVLILDEAVSALDISVQAQVLNLLKDLQAEFGLAYVFISHDLSVVRFMADEVMVMKHGRVVEQGNAASLWHEPQHLYTQQLIAAVPKLRKPTNLNL